MTRVLRVVLTGLRWWAGVEWLAAGVVAIVWGPVEMSRSDWGGFYLLIGGVVLAIAGWLVHPWGRARRYRYRPS